MATKPTTDTPDNQADTNPEPDTPHHHRWKWNTDKAGNRTNHGHHNQTCNCGAQRRATTLT